MDYSHSLPWNVHSYSVSLSQNASNAQYIQMQCQKRILRMKGKWDTDNSQTHISLRHISLCFKGIFITELLQNPSHLSVHQSSTWCIWQTRQRKPHLTITYMYEQLYIRAHLYLTQETHSFIQSKLCLKMEDTKVSKGPRTEGPYFLGIWGYYPGSNVG